MATFNKFWKVTLVVCLALCLCLVFAGCNKGEDTTGTTAPSTVGNSTYTIQVSTLSGAKLQNVFVYIYVGTPGGELETMKPLGEDGTISFEALTSDQYVAVLEGVPQGYNVQESYPVKQGTTEILLTPGVITDAEKPADKTYALGDVMYDFTITDSNGQEHTLSQLLQEKEAVVLNFWYLNCNPCKLEFPYLEMAYAEYSDRIEVLGINCEDGNDEELNRFASEYELTFPLAIGDKDYWYPAAYYACPTTIVIDRYGTIVYMHTGYFDSVASFNALFRTVTGEDYKQTFITDVEEIVTEDDYRPDGSEERPFELGGALEFDVKTPAKGQIHYYLYRLINVTMRIENPNAYVIVEGVEHHPVDGVIQLLANCEDTMKPLHVVFVNTSSEKNTIHVEFVFEPGNVNNPIELVHGENEVVIKNVGGLGQYYTYTATATGMLTIRVQELPAGATADVQLYNENTYEQVTESQVDAETGEHYYTIRVNAGDRVQVIFSAGTVDPDTVLESVTYKALASLVEDGGTGVHDGKKEYTVTVVDQNGLPVSGARITLSSAGQNAALTTNASGQISIRLTEDAYLLELAVPNGYVSEVNSYLWTPGMKSLTIQVYTAATYTVQVLDPQLLPVANTLVQVYGNETLENLLYAVTTDENGMITFIGKADAVYYLVLPQVREDLVAQEYYVTEGESTTVTLEEYVAPPEITLDSVVPEFTLYDPDGNEYTLSQLLQEKQVVVLTFWDATSGDSLKHMLQLQKIYETYGQQIAILAVNPVDTQLEDLLDYQTLYGLDFPMFLGNADLVPGLTVTEYPTTLVIDREGKVSLVYRGVLNAEAGEAIVTVFGGETYSHISFETLEDLLNYDPNANDPGNGGEEPPVEDPGNGGEEPPVEDPDNGGEQPPVDDPGDGGEEPPVEQPQEPET